MCTHMNTHTYSHTLTYMHIHKNQDRLRDFRVPCSKFVKNFKIAEH